MREYLTKIICLVLFIAVVLLVGASPVSAYSSMVSMEDSQAGACGETTTVPLCCLSAGCPAAYIAPINLTLPAGRLSPNNGKIYPVSQPASTVNQAPVLNNIKPLDTGPNQNYPPTSGINNRCRNCLPQEEPPLS